MCSTRYTHALHSICPHDIPPHDIPPLDIRCSPHEDGSVVWSRRDFGRISCGEHRISSVGVLCSAIVWSVYLVECYIVWVYLVGISCGAQSIVFISCGVLYRVDNCSPHDIEGVVHTIYRPVYRVGISCGVLPDLLM